MTGDGAVDDRRGRQTSQSGIRARRPSRQHVHHHERNPAEAARRLFNLFKSSPAGQSMQDEAVVAMLASAIDFIIPVENDAGTRAIGEVWFAPDAARRGEGFADLVRSM